jgi:DNA-binding NarL/FixJ family response regulator
MTRVLLYSDEPILIRGFETVLRQDANFELLPSCCTLPGLLERVSTCAPDLLVLDLTSEVNFRVLSELKRLLPNVRMLLWGGNISTEMAFQAMGLGVRGILRKTLPAELHLKCLHTVADGGLWFEKTLTESFLAARHVSLTRRESQLVSLLAQGLKNREIAATLMISEGSVKVYLSRLFEKVGVKDRFELALFGLKNLTTGQSPAGDNAQFANSVPALRSLVIERPVRGGGASGSIPEPALP